MKTMTAVVYKRYGDPSVLHFKEIEKPVPQPHEVLVKVHASTVSAGTIWARKGTYSGSRLFTFFLRLYFGLWKPKRPVLGFEFSGVVESVGNKVSLFAAGDAVYGTTTGLASGAYTAYICVPEKRKSGVITHKPAGISMEEAAALPIGGMTALHLLKKAAVKPGVQILIYGAAGSVGTYAVQLANYYGCIVTAATSPGNYTLLKSIGAHEVVSYHDLYKAAYAGKFDVLLDAVGKIPPGYLRRSLQKKEGKFISVLSMTQEKKLYLDVLENVIKQGRLKPVIDRKYPLSQIVKAHEYVDKGHKKGNVIILIQEPAITTASMVNGSGVLGANEKQEGKEIPGKE